MKTWLDFESRFRELSPSLQRARIDEQTGAAGEIQSIVILPFENITGDEQYDNLVAGMHSLLCSDIGRISGLRVISKTTSKLYKGSALSASEIAEELNADGVVEGSIMCLGDSVCMRFSLISTTGEEQQIWVGDSLLAVGRSIFTNERLN